MSGPGHPPALVRSVSRLTGDAALLLLQAAAKEATGRQLAVGIVVVDDGGRMLAGLLMDGAGPQALLVAEKKVYTAVVYRMPSDEFMGRARQFGPDGPAMLTAAVGSIMLLGGGAPVGDEEVIGAVGVSGGTGEQDKTIAAAAIAHVMGPPADSSISSARSG